MVLFRENEDLWSIYMKINRMRNLHDSIERDASSCLWSRDSTLTSMDGPFMIESDHKLLKSISRKNLADMPAWLQCMMLHLQGYDLTIHYHPGKETVIPDTLSQFSPRPGPNLPLDIAIHHACILPDCKKAFQASLHQQSRNASPHQPHCHWLA